MEDPIDTVERFNTCINRRDLDQLAQLLHSDYVFIDSAGNQEHGAQQGVASWRGFFEAFPDYVNIFDSVVSSGDTVAAVGRSECSVDALAGPAIWEARVVDGRIRLWSVHEDTPQVRAALRLPTT